MPKRPRRVRAAGGMGPDYNPRHLAQWPQEKLSSTPFVYDPARRTLICSFPRRPSGALSYQERDCLERVQRRIAQLERADQLGRVPFWIWPDREETAPIRGADPGWLNRWSRDRAAFSLAA